jgi:hypothetical protein
VWMLDLANTLPFFFLLFQEAFHRFIGQPVSIIFSSRTVRELGFNANANKFSAF